MSVNRPAHNRAGSDGSSLTRGFLGELGVGLQGAAVDTLGRRRQHAPADGEF